MSRITYVAPLLCLASISMGVTAGAMQAGNRLDGAALYASRCGGCHSIAANRVGPLHRGVVGRRAGTATGYAYSQALGTSSIVWTRANLDRWLQGPRAMVPGTRMFLTVADARERAAIIDFLQSQSPPR